MQNAFDKKFISAYFSETHTQTIKNNRSREVGFFVTPSPEAELKNTSLLECHRESEVSFFNELYWAAAVEKTSQFQTGLRDDDEDMWARFWRGFQSFCVVLMAGLIGLFSWKLGFINVFVFGIQSLFTGFTEFLGGIVNAILSINWEAIGSASASFGIEVLGPFVLAVIAFVLLLFLLAPFFKPRSKPRSIWREPFSEDPSW